MRATRLVCQFGIPTLVLFGAAIPAVAQEAILLAEDFKPGHTYTVDVQVKLSGKLSVPTEKGKPAQLLPLTGASHLLYDERILIPDEDRTLKAIRFYREVDFKRVLGPTTQDAGIRPSVRRLVVLKSGPKKAPFSPDGPLTWGEIDVVRTDVFSPAVVPGLLPPGPVKPGQTWKATPAAVAELTDMEKVDEGDLTVEFVGVLTVDGKRVARLKLGGTVRGVNEDGPNRQKLDGTAYFDLGAGILTYLSVKGTHELLDGTSGQTVGLIEGQFVMTRSAVAVPSELSDGSLRGIDLKPAGENTLLLYDNPDLGVRFLYPRGWRVGAVQGKQVTLDHARGAGILITVEPPAKVPTPEEYLREIAGFLQKEKAKIDGHEKPVRVRSEPVTLDRFAISATFGAERARLEYAVLRQTEGGATLAARLPEAEAGSLRPQVERIARSLSVTKKIE